METVNKCSTFIGYMREKGIILTNLLNAPPLLPDMFYSLSRLISPKNFSDEKKKERRLKFTVCNANLGFYMASNNTF